MALVVGLVMATLGTMVSGITSSLVIVKVCAVVGPRVALVGVPIVMITVSSGVS